MAFEGWTDDVYDDLCEATAATLEAKAAEIPSPGFETPTVYGVVKPRVVGPNTICVGWASGSFDDEAGVEYVTVEVQYLLRQLSMDVADTEIRKAARRIARIIQRDHLRHFANGGWGVSGIELMNGIIADADYYENPGAKRYDGAIITVTFVRGN